MPGLAAVPAAARFRTEVIKARNLGFRIQLRVDDSGRVMHAAFARLVPFTAKARRVCEAYGAGGIESRQDFPADGDPSTATLAVGEAIKSVLEHAVQA